MNFLFFSDMLRHYSRTFYFVTQAMVLTYTLVRPPCLIITDCSQMETGD